MNSLSPHLKQSISVICLLLSLNILAAQNLKITTSPLAVKIEQNSQSLFSIIASGYGKDSNFINLDTSLAFKEFENSGYIKYTTDELAIEYFIKQNSIRSNYIIENKPDGFGDLMFTIDIESNLPYELFEDRIQFTEPTTFESFDYGDFKIWDAKGKYLSFKPSFYVDKESKTIKLDLKIDDSQALYPIVVDPLFRSLVLTLISSPDPGAMLGFSGAFADVNGDGHDDIMAGAPYYDPGLSGDFGAVFLYLSNPKGINTTASFQFTGEDTNDNLGYSVSFGGDINDDGFDDFVAGAPGSNFESGVTYFDAGRAYIFYGGVNGITNSQVDTIYPPAPDYSGQFGWDVAGLGDVNGDEYGDVLVSAYYFWGGTGIVGRVYLYYGGPEGLSATPSWTYTCAQNGSGFAYKIGRAGDTNGDGYNDFLIGAPFFTMDSTNCGAAFLFYGSPTIPSGTPDFVFYPQASDAGFGFAFAGGMDVNNDGFDDFTISSPVEGGEALNCLGRIRNYHGSLAGPVFVQSFLGDFEMSGTKVSNAGDFNGDGFADMIYSCSGFEGFTGDCETGTEGSALFLGASAGLDTIPLWANDLYVEYEIGYGSCLFGDGDINLDGFDDYVTGVAGYDFPASNSGALFIYYGSPSLDFDNDLVDSIDIFKNKIISSTYQWEVATSFDLDLDNNGYNDVIVGSTSYPGGYGSAGGVAFHLNFGPGVGVQNNPVFTYEGTVDFQNLGNAVASLGDYNGDGYDDVAVASQDMDDRGAVYIFNGAPGGVSPTPTILYGASIPYTGAFGFKLIAEDLNMDGIKDLIVSDNFYNKLFYQQGAVFIFIGTISGYSNTPSFIIPGVHYREAFGSYLSKAGDVNNDGFRDIIVSSDYNGTAPEYRGGIKLFYGNALGIDTIPSSDIQGAYYGQALGLKSSEAGDVNGDGYDDVLILDRSQPEMFSGDGEVRLFYGSGEGLNEDNYWISKGGMIDAQLGSSFGGPVDLNADGYGDLVIGATGYKSLEDDNIETNGGIYVYYGSYNGVGLPNKIHEADTNATKQLLGYRNFIVSDYNGDGISELASLAPGSGSNLEILYFESAPSTCSVITSVNPSPLSTSIYLNWDGFADDYSYVVKWRTELDSLWADSTLSNPEISLINLEPCTNYLFLFQRICVDGSAPWTDTIVIQTTGCEIPCNELVLSGINAADVGDSIATISWELAPEAIAYEIQYKLSSSPTWNAISTTTISVTLTDLIPCNSYDYKVRPICISDTGSFSMTFNFNTVCPECEFAPAFLNISNITTTSAKVTFGPVAGAIKYKIWYRPTAGGVWKKATAAGTNKTIKSLIPNTNYSIKVQGVCVLTVGPFTPLSTFTTLPLKETSGLNPSDEVSVNKSELLVYPNPTSGVFHLGFKESFNNSVYELAIRNSLGQVLFVQNGNIYHTIEVQSDLPIGMYFVSLEINGIIYTQKLIIAR